MISRIVKEIEGYTVETCTYSADVSATGKPLIMYEIYNKNADLLEAFDNLQEAIDYIHRVDVVRAGGGKPYHLSL